MVYDIPPRILWIDALCINQSDIAERNSQVRMMGTIYASSAEVLAYLGPEYNDSDLAFDFFETMPADIDRHWDPKKYPELKSVYTLDHTIAVNDLFERAWWQRVWTVQESVLCPKLRIICGPRQLPADQLFAVGKGWFRHLYTCCQDTWYEIFKSTAGQPGLGDVCTALGKLGDMRAATEQFKFGQILSKFMSRNCSDPHDKLYGLLGFASKEEAAFIVPDYSKPVAEVFEAAALGLMQCTNSLDLLSMRLPATTVSSGRLVSDLPAWVPDWRQDSDAALVHDVDDRLCSLPRYNATLGSQCRVSSPKPGQLLVRGKIITKIAKMSTDDNHMDAKSLKGFFNNWRDLAGVTKNPQQLYAKSLSTTLDDAFWQTLCCSLMPDREYPRLDHLLQRTSDNSDHQHWYDAWWEWCEKHDCAPAKLMDIQSEYTRAEINVMGGWISTSINMRRLFVSEDPGWIGLVPVDTEVGDEVVLLEGGRVPYILRRARECKDASGTSLYHFVGAAYMHGVMDGSEWDHDRLKDWILV
ncbi:Heterokaryon incompatibility protein [Paramyrothecium foliicola]|nr:Heterokaryon incompatibility protein [Paramyrothecium foliicola]